MRAATGWSAFEVLDASAGEKLERWGQVTLVRPDPQVIWNTPRDSAWEKANARYNRSSEGGGSWSVRSLPQSEWEIPYRELRFRIRPTGFKHTGLFPEQAVNWDLMSGLIRAAGRQLNILNLFATPAAQPLPARQRAPGSATWTRAKGWSSGRGRMPRCRGFRNGRSGGSLTTAKSLSSGRSGAGCGTTGLSWTRPAMGAARAARSGSWRTASMSLYAPVRRYFQRMRGSFC